MARWIVQLPEAAAVAAALPFLNGARLGTNIVYAQRVRRRPRSTSRARAHVGANRARAHAYDVSPQLYRADLRTADDLAAYNAFPGRTVLLSGLHRRHLDADLQTVLRVYRLEGACAPTYLLHKPYGAHARTHASPHAAQSPTRTARHTLARPPPRARERLPDGRRSGCSARSTCLSSSTATRRPGALSATATAPPSSCTRRTGYMPTSCHDGPPRARPTMRDVDLRPRTSSCTVPGPARHPPRPGAARVPPRSLDPSS